MQLGIGTTLKLKDKADSCETLEILKKAELYISCIEGTATLKMFDGFVYEALTQTKDKLGQYYGAGLSVPTAQHLMINPNAIFKMDKDVQDRVLKAMKQYYSEHYVEENEYYRMLNGLPPKGDKPLYVPDGYDLPSIDKSIPIHEMDKGTISIIESAGVLDDLFNETPPDDMTEKQFKQHREYLKHLGKKKIDVYLARKAGYFDPLYIPEIDSDPIREMYIDKLNNNRTYTMRAVYSDAYRYGSDYYDNIMAIFIVMITMIDIISRVQEFITRKEIFDIRSCEYLFESYGVDFFPEIPLRYQIAMVKNIHQLLKYKSSAQCMVDICSLFGFDNIKVFKYYLLKDHNMDLTKDEYSFTGNPEEDYTLKFIKLPLEDDLDDYIRNPSNHLDYDELTEGDPTWDGGLDHDLVKAEILKEEFNIVRTKYISIDTVYDIAKISAEMTYFFNMLYDNYEKEELLKVRIPFIDATTQYQIADAFSMLTALSYYYYGYVDELMCDQDRVLYVNGFNFKADLAELAATISNTPYLTHAKELLERFELPGDQIPSFEQMMTIFVNNLNIRDELIEGMRTADNLRIYLVYKELYDALMTVQLTMDHFKNPETGDFYRDNNIDESHPEGYATYTEYFRNQVPTFYYELMDILAIEDSDDRKQRIASTIDSIVMALENYINLDEFQSFLHGLPAVSAEAVKQYIAQVINFFKSYKVDFLGLNTIYYLDDKLDGLIRVIDHAFLFRNFTKEEKVKIHELVSKLRVTTNPKERFELLEVLHLDIYTWAMKEYKERLNIYDSIPEKNIQLEKYSVAMINEIYDISSLKEPLEFIHLREFIGEMNTTQEKKDSLKMWDKLWIEDVYDSTDSGT